MMSDIVDSGSLPTVPPLSPNSLLEPHRHYNRPHIRCVVASVRTHSVPLVQDSTTHAHERLSVHEFESMQGWPPGISGGIHTPIGSSYSTRLSHIGNALNGHQCYQILRHIKPGPVATAQVHSMCFEKMTAAHAQCEQQFSQMTMAQLVSCFQHRAYGRNDGWHPAPPDPATQAGAEALC